MLIVMTLLGAVLKWIQPQPRSPCQRLSLYELLPLASLDQLIDNVASDTVNLEISARPWTVEAL